MVLLALSLCRTYSLHCMRQEAGHGAPMSRLRDMLWQRGKPRPDEAEHEELQKELGERKSCGCLAKTYFGEVVVFPPFALQKQHAECKNLRPPIGCKNPGVVHRASI